jgi:DNA-binding NtrC family response regulator
MVALLSAPMISVLWSGRPPDVKLIELMRGRGIRIADRAAADVVVAEIVTAAARAVTADGRADGVPWIWFSAGVVSPDDAATAIARGAYDVIDARAPGAAATLAQRVGELVSVVPPVPATDRFVAASDAARAVLREVAQAARTSMPVLLTGETGTGKEVAARLLHEWSSRRARAFVPINCAAIPNELIEAELFGYAKGAFTGSVRAYGGQLTAAAGGTVFLDEVDDTPLPFQVKLLRVLEDRVVSRIGENTSQVVDFRILAATNRDLVPLCAAGAFGADLYERLAIVSIRMPPLRERIADLPALVSHFARRFYKEEPEATARHRVDGATPAAVTALCAYSWPGNIRELRNVIFEALVHKRAGNELLLSDLPRRVLRRDGGAAGGKGGAPDPGAGDAAVNPQAVARAIAERRFDLRRAVGELERSALEAALAAAGGSAAGAARLLGRVGRGDAHDPGGTVRAMMRRLGVGAWVAGELRSPRTIAGGLEPFEGSRKEAEPRAGSRPSVSSGARRRPRRR